MSKKGKTSTTSDLSSILTGAKTATTKKIRLQLPSAPNEEMNNEQKAVEGEPTAVNIEGTEELSPTDEATENIETAEEQSPADESTENTEGTAEENLNEMPTEAAPILPKKFQVILSEEDFKKLNSTVNRTGVKRTKLVNQMIEYALVCTDDFIRYVTKKEQEPSINSILKKQEDGRPKFLVPTVKKVRKENFLLTTNTALIDKVDILAKELEISRNKFVNEAILFALESM